MNNQPVVLATIITSMAEQGWIQQSYSAVVAAVSATAGAS